MKDKFLSFIFLFLLVSSVASYFHINNPASFEASLSSESAAAWQTEKKPRQDYMKTLLSRNTKPLGLKENKTLNTLLEQPHIKWVIRSEMTHILN